MILPWLGDAAATMSAEQIVELEKASSVINGPWSSLDDGAERDSALTGACQYICGEGSLREIGAAWLETRRAEVLARAALYGAVIAAAGAGVSESEISRQSGMGRLSVRKALGK